MEINHIQVLLGEYEFIYGALDTISRSARFGVAIMLLDEAAIEG